MLKDISVFYIRVENSSYVFVLFPRLPTPRLARYAPHLPCFRFHHLAEMNVGKRGAQCFPCNRELRVTVGIRAHTKQTMVFVHNIYCINGANV